MTSAQSPRAPGAQPLAAGESLFEAPSYAEWGRGVLRVRDSGADVAMLWDSTIAEPTAALMDVVRNAFSPSVTSRYVSVFADGNRFAIEALAQRYGLATGQILTTTGATGALALTLKALVEPGDQVLVEQPGFDVLARQAREVGAVVGHVRRPAPDFRVDLDDLADRLTPRTRAVLITNLHNPSGARLTPAEIAAIAAVADRVGAVLVVDEVYADFAREAGDPPAATLAPNIVTVSSLTKVFGLFALKFGWLTADAGLLAKIRAAAPDGDIGISKLSHAVAAHVLEAPAPFEAHWTRTLAATRAPVARTAEALLRRGLLEGELQPYGCMYFPRVPGVDDTRALARRLFERHGVLVAPGEYFGAPGRLRIGFGADVQTVELGLARLAEGLAAER
ncbi:pyridoxal phosphate-dependent aminotransferase [Phenylobacterium kunshanense]|uniref:Pyridoxal phosphate-dependent aminotransferase n=1 Tax=Phenylobacterium kunshanense TaxID=1445034 RepID=A0A328BHB8_9CAUL|nr:pyridoxal phosphate-dependent aminotransferase [Phenylobacterium kunshanense]RAK66347.1 pyridoxal phosphate-dependent aminotransferase [Phenylobacterium kunshanense]